MAKRWPVKITPVEVQWIPSIVENCLVGLSHSPSPKGFCLLAGTHFSLGGLPAELKKRKRTGVGSTKKRTRPGLCSTRIELHPLLVGLKPAETSQIGTPGLSRPGLLHHSDLPESEKKKHHKTISSGHNPQQHAVLVLVLAPRRSPCRTSWNSRGTVVEPLWNPRGTLPQGLPRPPRSLSGLRPQSFQLLGKKQERKKEKSKVPWRENSGSASSARKGR